MDLTNILEAVISLSVLLITAFAIPYIKTKVDNEQLTEAIKWVEIAVSAAEQIFTETKQGVAKKQYVLNFLKEQGFTVNTDMIDNLIESAVHKLTTELGSDKNGTNQN